MNLVLVRTELTPEYTLGRLYVSASEAMATIERPWLNNRGFVSCVPEGEYELVPFTRPSNGDEVWALRNHDLGVGINKGDSDRYAILIHPANFVTDIAGCIAPGMGHSEMFNPNTQQYEHAVYSSRAAMDRLLRLIGWTDHTLTIRSE